VLAERRQRDALFHGGATAGPLDDALIGMVGNEASVVGQRLHHRKRPRGWCLDEKLFGAEAKRRGGGKKLVSRGGAADTGACGRDRPLHEHGELRDAIEIFLALHDNGRGLREADRLQGAPGRDLVLHTAQACKIRNHGLDPEPRAQGGDDGDLLLRRQQHIDGARRGDPICRVEPLDGIVGELRHLVQCADMAGETGEAERR
jgi:hypothetical protein